MERQSPKELVTKIFDKLTEYGFGVELGQALDAQSKWQKQHRHGLHCFAFTFVLLQHFFDLTEQQLLFSRISSDAYSCFIALLQLADSWIFPTSHKGRRHNCDIELLWAALNCCKSLLWLRKASCCRQARAVLQILQPCHRDALCNPDLVRNAGGQGLLQVAVKSLISMQWEVLTCGSAFRLDHASMVYTWVGSGFAYCGFATRTRQNRRQLAHGGVVYRWLEHECNRHRLSVPEAKKLRYRLARRFPVCHTTFVGVRAGPIAEMSTIETVSIKSLPFNANGYQGFGLKRQIPTQVSGRRTRPFPSSRERVPISGIFDNSFPKDGSKHTGPKGDGNPPRSRKQCMTWRSEWWWRESFKHVYVAWQRAVFGIVGPIDIYLPQHWPLLVLFLGSLHACIQWDRLQASWGVDNGALAAAVLLDLVFGTLSKQRATRRINVELRRCCLPPVSGIVVRVNFSAQLPVVRRCIRMGIWQSDWYPSAKAWLLSHIRVRVGKLRTHLQYIDASAASLQVQKSEYDSMSVRRRERALNCRGLRWIGQRWDVLQRPDVRQMVHEARSLAFECVQAWCQSLSSLQLAHMFPQRWFFTDRTILKQYKIWEPSDRQHQSHTKKQRPHSGHHICADDQDKKTAWLVSRETFVANLFYYVAISRAWSFTSLDLDSANRILRDTLQCFLPPRLCKWLGLDQECLWLPHIYNTIKSKCFCNVFPHYRTCSRAAHSCCRKIVSYCKWKKKQNWRMISRALETMTKKFIPGFEVWRLREAASDLRSSLSHLHRPRTCCNQCFRCHGPKNRFEGLVADAGQFFESVQASEADEAFLFLIQRAVAAGSPATITVFRSARRRAYMGGSVGDPSRSKATFDFLELGMCLAAFVRLNLARVGDAVVKFSGVPIGGHLSKAVCSLILCRAETEWYNNRDYLVRARYVPPGLSWSEVTSCKRYVDDVILISAILCASCLRAALSEIYPVEFEVASSGTTLAWLDLKLDLSTLDIDLREKQFVTPPAWASSRSALRCFILSHVSRWLQIGLTQDQFIHHTARLLVDLKHCGWDQASFRHVYFAIRGRAHCLGVRLLLVALKLQSGL